MLVGTNTARSIRPSISLFREAAYLPRFSDCWTTSDENMQWLASRHDWQVFHLVLLNNILPCFCDSLLLSKIGSEEIVYIGYGARWEVRGFLSLFSRFNCLTTVVQNLVGPEGGGKSTMHVSSSMSRKEKFPSHRSSSGRCTSTSGPSSFYPYPCVWTVVCVYSSWNPDFREMLRHCSGSFLESHGSLISRGRWLVVWKSATHKCAINQIGGY